MTEEQEKDQRRMTRPRPYFLRAADVVERNQWMRDIRKAARKCKAARKAEESMPIARKYQMVLRKFYTHGLAQVSA